MELGAPFKRGVVASFGYEVPYAQAGSGDVIISMPGSAGLEMSTAKDMLAGGFRVIELDPPGWGETPALQAEMKQRQLAVILAEAVSALGVERYHLIGTSMGGTNAMWVAQQFPDRVRSLTLEGPMVFCRPEDLVNPDTSFIDALRSGAPAPDVSAYPAPPPHPRKPWATADFFREQMRRRFKMMAKTDFPGENGPLEAFARTTKIPTTLLLGTADEILNQCYGDRFRSMMPSATVISVEGAGHDIQNTAPETFVAAVRAMAG